MADDGAKEIGRERERRADRLNGDVADAERIPLALGDDIDAAGDFLKKRTGIR